MKKIIIILSITLLLLLNGCDIRGKNGQIDVGYEEKEEYIAYDLETLFEDLSEVQKTGNQNTALYINGSNSKQTGIITIPVLQSDKFILSHIEVTDLHFMYYFDSTSASENLSFDYNTGIVVSVTRLENTFESYTDQLGISVTNDTVYDSVKNTWYLNDDGKCIYIRFPNALTVNELEMIDDYFIFEKYSVDSTGVNKIENAELS